MKAVFVQRLGPQTASYRYRTEMPARQLGMSVNASENGEEGVEADVLVIAKPTPTDVELATTMKAQGVKIVADFCDDHFRHPTWGRVYTDLAQLADRIVVATENMAGRLVKYLGKRPDAIIPDPYEEPGQAPHADGRRYLWFGGPTNLKDLRPWFPSFEGRDLTILTLDPRQTLPMEYRPWTKEAQTVELSQANLVILPTRKGVEYKSPNRLVNALRAGCFPICGDQIPSYHEFRRVAWVGSFQTGIKWAEACQSELNDRVAEGQAYIEKFSIEAVSTLWLQVIES